MAWLDQIVYRIKAVAPWVYDLMAASNSAVTVALYGHRIRRALRNTTISGTILGEPGMIRQIGPADLDAVDGLVSSMPEEHLVYFHPHGLDRKSLRRVLKSRTVLTYGLFLKDELVAYSILKLFATKRAYLGRLVSPSMTGLGVGRFLARYLYWQGYQLGFAVCGTMHQDNVASQKSHIVIRPYRTLATLPHGYNLIQFDILDSDANPPELCIERKPKANRSSPTGDVQSVRQTAH